MFLDFEIEKKRILWVNYSNKYAWNGDIIGYINKNNNKLLSKKQYEEMIEREIYEKWYNMDIEQILEYEDFEDFRKNILDNPDNDYEPLVEIIINENDDIEKYKPYLEMHWLEILALENEVSIYQIAKKGGLSTSTLYSIIDKDIQLCDITTPTLNAICKGLGISIMELIYKYEGRLF